MINYNIYFKSELRGLEEVSKGCNANDLDDILNMLQYYKDQEPTEIEGKYIAVLE